MDGGRIKAVKAALQIMLRSLPSRNTTFNIVSFGSHFTSLWPQSQIYSAETVAEASKHVDTFSANYGGTELRSALQFAFSGRPALSPNATEQPPTSVFVLTDGEAWDLDGIINLTTESVQAAKEKNNLLRTFVLGVGNQVSTAMCEGIARAGKGTAVYVAVRIYTNPLDRVLFTNRKVKSLTQNSWVSSKRHVGVLSRILPLTGVSPNPGKSPTMTSKLSPVLQSPFRQEQSSLPSAFSMKGRRPLNR